MKKTLLRNLQDAEDFTRGATLFGVGGGGAYQVGVDLLMEQINEGKEVGWLAPEDLDDEAYTMCPWGMGSLAPITEQKRKMMDVIGLEGEGINRAHSLATAARTLENHLGIQASAYIPFEIGGRQTASCIAAAAVNGILCLDGDYAGRSVPEATQTLANVYDIDISPCSLCDAWGDIAYLDKIANVYMAERIGKMYASAAFNGTAMAGFVAKAGKAKQTMLSGSLTKTFEVGRFIRRQRSVTKDVPKALAEYIGGWVLGSGVVAKTEWWEENGYYWGYHCIEAQDGTVYKVSYKNENYLLERNGEVMVTSPDMIMMVHSETAEPYHNSEVRIGDRMTFIGAPAIEAYKEGKGLELLGPQNYGLDIPYVPIEKHRI